MIFALFLEMNISEATTEQQSEVPIAVVRVGAKVSTRKPVLPASSTVITQHHAVTTQQLVENQQVVVSASPGKTLVQVASLQPGVSVSRNMPSPPSAVGDGAVPGVSIVQVANPQYSTSGVSLMLNPQQGVLVESQMLVGEQEVIYVCEFCSAAFTDTNSLANHYINEHSHTNHPLPPSIVVADSSILLQHEVGTTLQPKTEVIEQMEEDCSLVQSMKEHSETQLAVVSLTSLSDAAYVAKVPVSVPQVSNSQFRVLKESGETQVVQIENVRSLQPKVTEVATPVGAFTNELDQKICCICFKKCRSELALALHLVRTHGARDTQDRLKKYPCKVCGKVFYENSHLARHLRETTCRLSDYAKIGSRSLEKDIEKDTAQDKRQKKAAKKDTAHEKAQENQDEEDGDSLYNLMRQCEEKEAPPKKSKRSHICSICEKALSTASKLNNHMFLHTGNTTHKCTVCQKGFGTNYDLKQHTMSLHCDEKSFSCESCQRGFYTKKQLSVHQRTCKGCIDADQLAVQHRQQFPCGFCGQVYFSQNQLIQHLKIHQDIRPFKCQVCNKRFKRQKLLDDHVLIHREERNFTCGECNAAFKQERGLQMHRRIHQPVRIRYKCPHCDWTTTGRGHIKDHLNSHFGRKPYLCEVCGKAFGLRVAWRNHIALHGEKKYKCDMCNVAFYLSAKLSIHKRKVHKINAKKK